MIVFVWCNWTGEVQKTKNELERNDYHPDSNVLIEKKLVGCNLMEKKMKNFGCTGIMSFVRHWRFRQESCCVTYLWFSDLMHLVCHFASVVYAIEFTWSYCWKVVSWGSGCYGTDRRWRHNEPQRTGSCHLCIMLFTSNCLHKWTCKCKMQKEDVKGKRKTWTPTLTEEP